MSIELVGWAALVLTQVFWIPNITRILKKPVYWDIPHDNSVGAATQAGTPVVAARPKARAVRL